MQILLFTKGNSTIYIAPKSEKHKQQLIYRYVKLRKYTQLPYVEPTA